MTDETRGIEGQERSLARLRATARAWIAVSSLVLGGGALAAGALAVPPASAVALVLGAGLAAAHVLRLFSRRLGENRDPVSGVLLPALGLATHVTLFRALLVAALAGLLAIPELPPGWALVPGGLYASAAILDRLDGYLARITGHVTRLGGQLDVEVDALGLLVAPLLAVRLGRLPYGYLGLSAAYYLFRATLFLRARLGRPVYEARLRPSQHSRMFAGLQMVLVAVALFPFVPRPIIDVSAALFMTPVLVGFARDYLVATGTLLPESPRYRRGLHVLIRAVRRELPLGLRLGLVLLGSLLARVAPDALAEVSALGGDPLFVLGLVLMVLGAAGRIGAVLVLAALCSAGPQRSASASALALAAFAVTILILGTGRASLAQPEEAWLFARSGEHGTGLRAVARALLTLAGGALALWALGRVSWGEVAALAGRLPPLEVALALVLNAVALGLWNLRGHGLARELGIQVGAARFFAHRISAFAISYVTPGPPIAGEPLLVLRLAREPGGTLTSATQAALWDRGVELAVSTAVLSALVAVAGLELGPLLPGGDRLEAIGRWAWAGGAVVALAGVLGAAWVSRRVRRRPERLGRAVLLSLGGWALSLAELTVVWHMLGVALSLPQALSGLALARLAFLLPIPAGAGALEASQSHFASAVGHGPAEAIAFCLWVRARDLALVALGALVAGRVSGPADVRPERAP